MKYVFNETLEFILVELFKKKSLKQILIHFEKMIHRFFFYEWYLFRLFFLLGKDVFCCACIEKFIVFSSWIVTMLLMIIICFDRKFSLINLIKKKLWSHKKSTEMINSLVLILMNLHWRTSMYLQILII